MESCGAEGSGVVFSEPLPDQVALAGVVLTELCPEDPVLHDALLPEERLPASDPTIPTCSQRRLSW